MIMSKRHGLKAATASWFATCMLSSLMSYCSIAYCQTDPKGVPLTKEQLAKNEDESKLWHETMEKFNGLVKEQKWREAEDLANETASKFGSAYALVQGMLWISINGQRKSQGLAPLIREMKAPDTKAPIIMMYSLQDVLPKADKEVPVFVDVLTQCISAAIESGGTENPESKIVYDTENKRLIVAASKAQQQLVDAILKRVNKTTNAKPQKERAKSDTQLQSLLKLYPNADADKDGWLTQAEVRELFPDADANGDGKVTPVEARNYLAKQKN